MNKNKNQSSQMQYRGNNEKDKLNLGRSKSIKMGAWRNLSHHHDWRKGWENPKEVQPEGWIYSKLHVLTWTTKLIKNAKWGSDMKDKFS